MPLTWKYVKKNLIMNKYLYIMLIPVFAWYITFCYVPMFGIIMSFQNFSFSKGFFGSEFIGFENFRILIADRFFIQALQNTIIIGLMRIAFIFPIPIIFALLLSQLRWSGLKRVVQTSTYFPFFISWIAMAGILNSLLSIERGTINIIIESLGFERIDFLTAPENFRWLLIFSDIFRNTGWSSIMYLAAIVSVDKTLYESAEIDGADRWQQMIYVTLPGILPVITILFILNVGTVFSAGFDQIFNLYNPMVYATGDILDTYIFRTLRTSTNLALPAAAGMVRSVISLCFLVTANKITKMLGQEGIF